MCYTPTQSLTQVIVITPHLHCFVTTMPTAHLQAWSLQMQLCLMEVLSLLLITLTKHLVYVYHLKGRECSEDRTNHYFSINYRKRENFWPDKFSTFGPEYQNDLISSSTNLFRPVCRCGPALVCAHVHTRAIEFMHHSSSTSLSSWLSWTTDYSSHIATESFSFSSTDRQCLKLFLTN